MYFWNSRAPNKRYKATPPVKDLSTLTGRWVFARRVNTIVLCRSRYVTSQRLLRRSQASGEASQFHYETWVETKIKVEKVHASSDPLSHKLTREWCKLWSPVSNGAEGETFTSRINMSWNTRQKPGKHIDRNDSRYSVLRWLGPYCDCVKPGTKTHHSSSITRSMTWWLSEAAVLLKWVKKHMHIPSTPEFRSARLSALACKQRGISGL